ncbi:MAG: hypothetical protein K5853_09305, partial [Lachnospiraceae bacterium]|nr:hypothetical protein [Lachnospiraceae bacterium]
YKDYPDMHTYYMDEVFYYDHSTVRVRKEEIRNRNFFYYGLTKIAPVFMQSPLYNEGLYNEIYDTEKDSATQRVTSPSTAEGLDEGFMKGYTVMEKLPEISKIEDDEEGTFLLLSSNMTHETVLLQKPDYVPAEKVDNTEYDAAMAGQYVIDGVEMKMETEDQQEQYSTNMAAYLELAKWFRYMKEQGVYDNTRIILVSDHGWPVGQFGLTLPDGTDTEKFRALLMVKDFDATGFTTDDTFMTNADVPVLTLNGLVEDPVNPFTKKKLTMEPKKEGILISDPDTWVVSMDKKPQPGKWYSFVGDNASDMSQWEYVGEH